MTAAPTKAEVDVLARTALALHRDKVRPEDC